MHASIHPSIHPSTHPSIHVTHVIMRFGLVKPFQQRDSPNALQFRSTAVYTSTTVLCPWYGGRSKVSNQIDAGKEEQTSTVSCSWDRLSLGKNFDRDSIVLLPEWHGTLLRIAQVRLHGKRPAYFCCAVVLGCWESNLMGFVSWWLPNLHWPYGFDRQVRWRFYSHKSPRQGFNYCSWSIVEAWGSRTSYGYSSKWLTSQNWIPRTFAKDVQDLAEWKPTRPLATGHCWPPQGHLHCCSVALHIPTFPTWGVLILLLVGNISATTEIWHKWILIWT